MNYIFLVLTITEVSINELQNIKAIKIEKIQIRIYFSSRIALIKYL